MIKFSPKGQLLEPLFGRLKDISILRLFTNLKANRAGNTVDSLCYCGKPLHYKDCQGSGLHEAIAEDF